MKHLADGSSSNTSTNIDTATNKGETKFGSVKKQRATMSKGAWTPEEDHILSETVAIHGPKRWKRIAASTGLKRCGKSCRLRWMNYLRPNIKRGNISDQEEDLILRLHKLLGNRWSLIAGRLPGRTDNEIKNYWNSHLSKRVKKAAIEEECSNVQDEQHLSTTSSIEDANHQLTDLKNINNDNKNNFITNEQFDYLSDGFFDGDWVSSFLELDGCA